MLQDFYHCKDFLRKYRIQSETNWTILKKNLLYACKKSLDPDPVQISRIRSCPDLENIESSLVMFYFLFLYVFN
jgi:hypothetical protein